jgi:hypothetical protein
VRPGRVVGEIGFLVLVGFSIVGACALRVAAAVSDLRERVTR